MELNKTLCKDCGHLRRWQSYKWPSTPERQEWNRKGRTECEKCGSNNVEDVEDAEVMAPYSFAAGLLSGAVEETKEPEPTPVGVCTLCGGKMGRHDLGIPYCLECGRTPGKKRSTTKEEVPLGPPEPCRLGLTPEQQDSAANLQWMLALTDAAKAINKWDVHGNERSAFEIAAELRLKEIDLLEPLVEDSHRLALKRERVVLVRQVQEMWSQRLAEAESTLEE